MHRDSKRLALKIDLTCRRVIEIELNAPPTSCASNIEYVRRGDRVRREQPLVKKRREVGTLFARVLEKVLFSDDLLNSK